MSAGRAIRAAAELARVSNLPTVVTNVLVGCAIGAAAAPDGPAFPWSIAATMSVAVGLLYVGGMALNDVVDSEIDRAERPERPIPSGRLSRRAACVFAVACLVAGMASIALHGVAAAGLGVALVTSIVVYDLVHKKTVAAVLVMGLCRALVYLSAAAAVAWPFDVVTAAWLAGALWLFIVMLTVVARVETAAERRGRFHLAAVLPLVAALALVGVRPGTWGPTIVALASSTTWLLVASAPLYRTPPRVGVSIQWWLAGICLIDWVHLTLLGYGDLAIAATICFAITLIAQRRIAGT